MDDQRCIVQFIHPGGEHEPDAGDSKGWNTDIRHRRKFIVERGRCLRGAEVHTGQLAFWGEWEPPSTVVARLGSPPATTPGERYPEYLMAPRLEHRTSYRGLQNTDPCVFGGFFYTGCLQRPHNRMRWLETGSVILFGSCISSGSGATRSAHFVLDTVFVVRDFIDHDARSYRQKLSDAVPAGYFDVTLGPWYAEESVCGPDDTSWRLYRGATYESPVEGMYSFTPAVPWKDQPRGFARPRILHPCVTPGKNQNYKLTPAATIDAAAVVWRDIRQQVLDAELWLGVGVDFPSAG